VVELDWATKNITTVKRLVVSLNFKMLKISAHQMFTKTEFQAMGAATAKAQKATNVVLVGG